MPLPSGSPPSPHRNDVGPDDWTPYKSRAQFELAELLYTKAQMSAHNIDQLMKIWAAHGAERGDEPPFLDHKDLYKTIDATATGHVPWQSFVTSYDGEIPQQGEVPSWMTAEHTIWFRDPHLLVHSILSICSKGELEHWRVKRFCHIPISGLDIRIIIMILQGFSI